MFVQGCCGMSSITLRYHPCYSSCSSPHLFSTPYTLPMPLLYVKLALTVSKVTIFIKNSYSNASCIFIKLIFLKRGVYACARAHTLIYTFMVGENILCGPRDKA